jgi:transposase
MKRKTAVVKMKDQARSFKTTTGLDLGDKTSRFCVIDEAGGVIERGGCATSRRGMRKEFEHRPAQVVVIEVGTHSPWVSTLLTELGHKVIVANPRRVRLIAASMKKNDDIDAELLARLGRADEALLAPIEHRGVAAQSDLAVIKSRDALVQTRTKLVNHVRGLMKSVGERLPSCTPAAFPKVAAPLLPEALRPVLKPMLATIAAVTAGIKKLTRVIEKEMPEKYPEMERLMQVNGVGPITAAAFILTLEDPKRFTKSRKVGAYVGLTTRRHQSGENDPELRISKAGSPLLRRLLVNCAHHILGAFGTESDLRTWGLGLAARGKKNAKKRAVVAVARKLSVLLHRLWVTGEDYQAIGYHQSRQRGGQAA